VPLLHTATKTNAAVIAQPSSLFETGRSGHTPANPHRLRPLPAQTPPAVSSLEAFRTPASEYLITPVTGRRPKTLNSSGRRLTGPAADRPKSRHVRSISRRSIAALSGIAFVRLAPASQR